MLVESNAKTVHAPIFDQSIIGLSKNLSTALLIAEAYQIRFCNVYLIEVISELIKILAIRKNIILLLSCRPRGAFSGFRRDRNQMEEFGIKSTFPIAFKFYSKEGGEIAVKIEVKR